MEIVDVFEVASVLLAVERNKLFKEYVDDGTHSLSELFVFSGVGHRKFNFICEWTAH